MAKSKQDNIIAKFDTGKIFDKYIKQLHNDRSLDKETKKQLFASVYQPLKEAVKEGFGQVTAKVEYGTPNFEMLKNLQFNVGVFSVFKNHSMVKEIVGLLKDSDGNLKPFNQFKNDALLIDAKYRQRWLKVEYDTAVRMSRMAAQWERFQRTKHLYPNLEYIRTRSAHPREDHLAFVGIIRPVDDPFWNTHMPTNGFGCECSARQTDKDATDIPDGLPEVPKAFAFNPGKTGQAFSIKNSEYIKAASPTEMPKLIKEANAQVNKDMISEMEYLNYYKSKNGGAVDVHPLTIKNSDFNEVLKAARSLANNGSKIKMLPDLNDSPLRSELLPVDKIKAGKNPDYLINDDFVADLKIINGNGEGTIHNAFKRCNQQCNNIVMYVPEENTIELNNIYRYAKGKLMHDAYKDFDKVWINYKGNWIYSSKQEIITMKF
ncbi:MAG TPA: phage minor head protein [Chitinophagales bacterium]|nr:phage minor head protein [Chitinophagales bacterium]